MLFENISFLKGMFLSVWTVSDYTIHIDTISQTIRSFGRVTYQAHLEPSDELSDRSRLDRVTFNNSFARR